MALITILTAEPGNGKSTAALGLTRYPRAVWFVPTNINKNKKIAKIPYVFLADMSEDDVLKLAAKGQSVRVVMTDEEASRLPEFMGPEWGQWTFVFDDMPQLFYTKIARNKFEQFAAGVRHRDGQIIVTTQRIKGIVPRFVQIVADEIYQVGPLMEMEEARILYYGGGSSRYEDFKAFHKALKTNPAYHLFAVKKSPENPK